MRRVVSRLTAMAAISAIASSTSGAGLGDAERLLRLAHGGGLGRGVDEGRLVGGLLGEPAGSGGGILRAVGEAQRARA